MRFLIVPVTLGFLPILSLLLPGRACAAPPQSPQDTDFFEKEVRPLLAQHCYACHSGASPKANLALDTRAGWQRGVASGPVIRPGDADHSLLIKAVRHAPGIAAMPPGTPLSEREIAALAKWIQQGAFDPRGATPAAAANSSKPTALHWAFQPVKNPGLPLVKNIAWCKTPVDRFILAKLEAKGLQPAPPADRRTLIRRVTYDLLGLPPTPAEVRAFEADQSPDAYEKLVDRLLASPRYGEKWGRKWLDLVHYGDTHGYDKDKKREHAWPYRDYVIQSFNQDKPYSRFIREQIAGDVLGEGTGNREQGTGDREQSIGNRQSAIGNSEGIVATGFLAAGPWDFVGHVELREGTTEKDKTRLLDRDDIVSTVMSTFTSMTVHCARCHDHKFDPIPQKDYYRLQAVFAGIDRGDRTYNPPERAKQEAQWTQQQNTLVAQRDTLLAHVHTRAGSSLSQLESETARAKMELSRLPLPPRSGGSPTNGYHSGIEARADTPKWVQVDMGSSLPIEQIDLLPARPTDFPDTPGFGFPVRFRVDVADDPTFAHFTTVADHANADFPNPGDTPVLLRVPNVKARYIRVTALRLWPRTNDYVFALAELQVFSPTLKGINLARGKPVTALDSIEAGRWSVKYLTDNFDSRNGLPDPNDPATIRLLARRSELASRVTLLEQAQQAELNARMDAPTRAALQQNANELARVQAQLASLPPLSLVYSVVPHAPRPIYVLARGDVEQKGERIGAGALTCVPGLNADFHLLNLMPEANADTRPLLASATAPTALNQPPAEMPDGEGRARLALADWIAAPSNPLTWRSLVNRVWQGHFGRGLVDTPSDFGKNGALPTHPELLDWLAYHFAGNDERGMMSDEWNTKPNSSLIIHHSSFSFGSLKKLHRLILLSAAYRQASSDNAAGAKIDADNRLLWRMNRRRLEAEEIRDSVLTISGKLDLRMGGPGFERFRFKDDHSPIYDYSSPEKNSDPATFRRAVYQFTVRSVPDPFLESLDSPDPNTLTPIRSTTLTPLSALSLRNDPFMVQQSDFFAQRLRALSPKPDTQIKTAYALLYGRKPTDAEQTAVTTYAQQHGLENACRLLFNTNEFVFID